MGQVGIPLFYLQGMGGGAVLKFRDLFNDSSKFWGWSLFKGATPAGKNGIELNGQFVLSIDNAVNGKWDEATNEAPRLNIGILTYPCEIKTRITSTTRLSGTNAGLHITKAGAGFGAHVYQSIGIYDSGIKVSDTGSTIEFVEDTTIPLWLRIRIANPGWQAFEAYFDYSLDGLHWTNLYHQFPAALTNWLFPSSGSLTTGLFVRNNGGEAITTGFDFFQMKPKSIN